MVQNRNGFFMNKISIYSNLSKNKQNEIFEDIISNKKLKLERIISNGQSTAPGQWYDQEKEEWVLLLKGKAGLLFEGEDEILELHAGDYVLIPAHVKHRVEWTDKKSETIWLALHF